MHRVDSTKWLRAERQLEREAAGGVLLRLRHQPDPGGHAGADRRWEGQIVSFCRRKRFARPEEVATSSGTVDHRQEGQNVSFCNLFADGLMLALAPLAAATATAIPVNAMAVAFCAAGTRRLGTCLGSTFASRDTAVFSRLALSVAGRV
jgi:hypothetical protein